MSDLDVPISQFLCGRYNRVSLRETLDGLLISDTLTMTIDDFVSGLRQQDQHIGRCFWRDVLVSLREAYSAYTALGRERALVGAATERLRSLIETYKRAPAIPAVTAATAASLNPTA
jgi:hypothetical protein